MAIKWNKALLIAAKEANSNLVGRLNKESENKSTLDIALQILYSNRVQDSKRREMTIQTTYTQARDGLAKLLDQATHNREVIVIQRRGEEDVALIAASELESLMESAYLLRSPKNADRLLSALGRALKGEGVHLTAEELRSEVGLD